MRGLGPRIHVFRATAKAWMAGTSPAMTAHDSKPAKPALAASNFIVMPAMGQAPDRRSATQLAR